MKRKVFLPLVLTPVVTLVGFVLLHLPIGNSVDFTPAVILMAGFTGGWVCGIPAAIILSLLRLLFFHDGALSVIFIFISTGIVSSFAHRYFVSNIRSLPVRFLILGFISSFFSLLSLFLVPDDMRSSVLKFNLIPALLVSPVSSLYIGVLIGTGEYRLQLRHRLEESEQSFRSLFDYNPVPLWLEDLSEVYKSLKFYSVTDIESLEYPELRLLFNKIKILSINKSAISFVRGANVADIATNLDKTLNRQSYVKFRNELLHMKQQGNYLQTEGGFRDLEGNDHSIIMTWNALNGPQKNYNKVLVSFTDVTDREEHQQQMAVLNREVHHRINNNLNMVAQLIQLEEDMNSEGSLDYSLKGLQQKIKAISLVHSQLYSSRDQNFIELHEFFKELFNSLSEILELDTRRIEVKLTLEKILVFTETAVTCGLLINELLAQSARVLGRDGGEIHCLLSPCPGGILLTYKDNRKDLVQEDEGRNNLSSLLIDTFIEKLDGTGRFPDEKEGFCIEIQFPVYPE